MATPNPTTRAGIPPKLPPLLLLALYALLFTGSTILFVPQVGKGLTLPALFKLAIVLYFQHRFLTLFCALFPSK